MLSPLSPDHSSHALNQPYPLHLPLATGSEVGELNLHGMLLVIELVLAQAEVCAERFLLFAATGQPAQQSSVLAQDAPHLAEQFAL